MQNQQWGRFLFDSRQGVSYVLPFAEDKTAIKLPLVSVSNRFWQFTDLGEAAWYAGFPPSRSHLLALFLRNLPGTDKSPAESEKDHNGDKGGYTAENECGGRRDALP